MADIATSPAAAAVGVPPEKLGSGETEHSDVEILARNVDGNEAAAVSASEVGQGERRGNEGEANGIVEGDSVETEEKAKNHENSYDVEATESAAEATGAGDAVVAGADGAKSDAGDGGGKKEVADDVSDDDIFAGLDDVASLDIFDLANYTFGKKDVESKSKAMQLLPEKELEEVLQKNYEKRGMRRSVGAVLVVSFRNFPHVLLLQRSDGKGEYALPGGRLRPGESDEEGLRRKLISKLTPAVGAGEDDQELDVGEKICNWHCIDFRRRYYPYVPAHVTKAKEELHVYTISLPDKFMFSVPRNLQLVAVPLFELYNNPTTYGDVISAIPALLSRWHINYC